ncbi:MAG: hypothetical protein FD136_764 [Chitinophagaceae bacterium]|nr:MAG: hypothetical protein FD136_764 [Chitinophagaceae bacterium]
MIVNKTITAWNILIVTLVGVLLQFIVMMQHTKLPPVEAVVRFFSYFTILSNLIVATFFAMQIFKKQQPTHFFLQPATSLSVTVYIMVVGLIYQVILSKLYSLQGLNLLANNILHGVTPIATFIFWLVFESKRKVQYNSIVYFLIYPLIYLIYTLIRGSIVQFYPYPFVDVIKLGLQQVFINSTYVMFLFLILFFSLAGLANYRHNRA